MKFLALPNGAHEPKARGDPHTEGKVLLSSPVMDGQGEADWPNL